MAAENYQKCLEQDLHTKDMKNLQVKDVAPIYERNYWGRLKCDDIPTGLDLCLFDFGGNAATGRAAKYLQRLIGTVADGGIGPNTLKALDEFISKQEHGVKDTILKYQAARQDYSS